MAKRLPKLDSAQLEAFEGRLSQSSLSKQQQRTIMASMRVAANPQAETPQFGYMSLTPTRRAIATKSISATSAIFTSIANDVRIGASEQSEIDDALLEAQVAGESKIEWGLILALLSFFLFPPAQEKALHDEIEGAYIAAWQLAVKEQAALYGCPNARIGSPTGASLRDIQKLARRDSESIAKTYNREAESALRRLYESNPLGTSNYYLSGMAQWANTRQIQKNLTIGIQNVQAGYFLGQRDFHAYNSLQTGYRFSGAPPVCPICSRLMGMGEVDFETMATNSCPVHPSCPHYWVATRVYKIPCSQMWVG